MGNKRSLMQISGIFGQLINGDALQFVYAYTNRLPLLTDIVIRKVKFLRNCASNNNGIVRTVFDWFGGDELMECYHSLDFDESHVGVVYHHMQSKL